MGPALELGVTHVGFVTAGLKDEFLGLVLPALHRGVGRDIILSFVLQKFIEKLS